MLVRVPQQLLPLVFGGGDDGGGDHAFLSSIFLRPSPFIIVIVFSGDGIALSGKSPLLKRERERERDSFFKVDSTLLIRGTL